MDLIEVFKICQFDGAHFSIGYKKENDAYEFLWRFTHKNKFYEFARLRSTVELTQSAFPLVVVCHVAEQFKKEMEKVKNETH